MRIVDQGGGCCGRRIMRGMDGATTASILEQIRINGFEEENGANKLIEIVVSEENSNLEQLKREIVGAGFVLVARWDNCSGSECWMYLWAPDWTAYPAGVPVVGPAAPALPPAPVPETPRVVASFWHNVLLAGRSTAGHASYVEARAAAPRCQRVDRMNVYASGQRRWIENVHD